MPGRDGTETMKQIRESDLNIPIIALTAFAMKEDEAKYLAQGFNDYISKSIDIENLMQKNKKIFE